MPRSGPRPFRPRVVRWSLAGRRCPANTPGAVREVTRSLTFFAKVNGVKVSLHTRDEGEAWIELRRLLGGGSPQAQARLPLADHIAAWLESLAGATAKRVQKLRTRVTHLAALAGWTRLAHLTRDSCAAALEKLLAEGLSVQTRNHYLSHARQFARWCVEAEPPRLARNPFAALRRLSVDGRLVHERRCPTDAEIGLLLAYLHSPRAKVRYKMSGPRRSLGYRVSMATGFRASELASLSRQSFDLDGGTVTVAAGYSKRRRRDVQPLPPWLVEELREWFAVAGIPATAPLWPFPADRAGQVLKADLRAAGVEYVTLGPDGGKLHFDFHALRHYYCTSMAAQPGMDPKTLITLMRLADIALALKTYAKTRQPRVRAAVAGFPVVAPAHVPAVDSGGRSVPSSTPEQPGEKAESGKPGS